MTSFGPMIIESGTENIQPSKTRQTVRGIILNDKHQVLMVYSDRFNDYTFPGGGIKPDESHLDALIRELKEEIGAEGITIEKLCGTTQETRFGIRGETDVYIQTSFYYLCHVKTYGQNDLNQVEKSQKLRPVWIDIEHAILQNERVHLDQNHQSKGLKTVLIRENMVLKNIKEHCL